MEAIQEQDRIGWQSFIEGFWTDKWRIYQQHHFDEIHSTRSSLLWISKLQRRIWQIAWSMWEQRNDMLHNQGSTIHQYDTELLDQEIRKEWASQNVPARYNYLFRGSLEDKLHSSTAQKQSWITNLWTAQEAHAIASDNRNDHVTKIFERWKARNSKTISHSD